MDSHKLEILPFANSKDKNVSSTAKAVATYEVKWSRTIAYTAKLDATWTNNKGVLNM